MDVSCLDASGAEENSLFDLERYYAEKYRIEAGARVYYSQNSLIVQFARDRAADQRLKFVYKKDGGGWLFISDSRVFLHFVSSVPLK